MTSPFPIPDEFVQGFVKAGQNLWQALLPAGAAGSPAPLDGAREAADKASRLADLQLGYLRQQVELWMRLMAQTGVQAGGLAAEPVIRPERGDRRFRAAEWSDSPAHDALKQSYLLNSRLLADTVEAADLDAKTKHRVRFFTDQLIDAMSPANFATTNPETWKQAFESKGESLREGFDNLLGDLRKGRLTITDEGAFEVGTNVATSKGAVVFENDLFQLIQYAPLTEKVAARPLVIVPPCINKFYILDLQPENSFVRYAAAQGMTVFVVSWRNPDASLGHLTWDDYVALGAIPAFEVARQVAGADQVNALGWCVGGTIVSAALAVLRARGDRSVASLTLLTTMLDFSHPGDLGVFIDEQGVAAREATIGRGGIYPGAELGFVFQTLRANDLIWPYVVNNYLKGKAPAAFDLLYWNADSTNLPGPMYAWYLRNMYLENNLVVPNRLTICGTPVDLGKIDMPSFVVGTEEDHIVPWRGAYRTTQLLGGPVEFVLGASGHIAGVINPPAENKRSYWTGARQGEDADLWRAESVETKGSWWPRWIDWLRERAGEEVAARADLGSESHPPLEPAPGRFVKVRAG